MAEGLNEQDVREDFAAPLLKELGYAKNTAADIWRELPLSYERSYLGHKKPADQPLRGRPDYVLVVAGAGRWVLEVKAPDVDISRDQVEQVLSYARHPEVAAVYAGLYNSRRFVLYQGTQPSTADPLIDLSITSPAELAAKLASMLTPAAIRRDWSPRKVDLGRPLADGLRSEVALTGGYSRYTDFRWTSNLSIPTQLAEPLERVSAMFRDGYRSHLTGGNVRRDGSGRIVACCRWAFPHDAMLNFAQQKGLLDVEYTALDVDVSTNRNSPTVFDLAKDVAVNRGDPLYDLMRWQQTFAGTDSRIAMRGQAIGYIEAQGCFQGTFFTVLRFTFPMVPQLAIEFIGEGVFEITFDGR